MKADKPKENISKMSFMEYDIKGDPKTSCPSIDNEKALQFVRDSGRPTEVHYELAVPYIHYQTTKYGWQKVRFSEATTFEG